MVKAERAFTDEKVQKIISLKKKVSKYILCTVCLEINLDVAKMRFSKLQRD